MPQHFLNNNSRYNRIKRIDSHVSKFRTDDLTIQSTTHNRTFVHPAGGRGGAYCFYSEISVIAQSCGDWATGWTTEES